MRLLAFTLKEAEAPSAKTGFAGPRNPSTREAEEESAQDQAGLQPGEQVVALEWAGSSHYHMVNSKALYILRGGAGLFALLFPLTSLL